MSTGFAPPEVSPGNDFEVYAQVKKRHPTTPRLRIAATGLTVSAYLTATLGGSALAGTTVSCAEVGTNGEYVGTILGSTLTTALSAYADDTTLYLVVVVSTNVIRWEAVTVRKYPDPD